MRGLLIKSLATTTLVLVGFGCGGGTPEPETAGSETAKPPPPPPPPPPPVSDGPQEQQSADCPLGMVLMEGASFWMGSAKGQGRDDEHERFNTEVQDFCIDETEVTLETYQACVKNSICDAPPTQVQLLEKVPDKEQEKRSELCSGRKKDPLLPVNCVSQDDAVKFCQWKGYRLPTEKEMEFVAAAGADELEYPWGLDEPNANNACFKKEGPCLVKSVKPSATNVYDIVGNLNEWTSTPYGPYPDPPESADTFVVRGGSWKSQDPKDLGAKRRYHRPSITRDVDLGFRCAKTR